MLTTDLPQLPSLEQRAASGDNAWLYREALQNGYVNPDIKVRSTGIFFCAVMSDNETQLRCYLCESLLTALEHESPVIRIRAAIQAFNYAGRLQGLGKTPGPRHCDALLSVRNRLEADIQR